MGLSIIGIVVWQRSTIALRQRQCEWRCIVTFYLLGHHLEDCGVEGLKVLELIAISISLSKVKDQVPPVAVGVQFSTYHVLVQMRVTQVVRAKSESLTGFDDGITGTVQVNL